ncbi:hypothetical protein K3495_g3447 [Podosphaera aphanis]|nr:hypothetical protein K3495_g3447 [Podosphaera aphanis]
MFISRIIDSENRWTHYETSNTILDSNRKETGGHFSSLKTDYSPDEDPMANGPRLNDDDVDLSGGGEQVK